MTAVDETGGKARTYVIDDRLILKTQRPQQLRPRTSLRKEVVFLKQLEGVEGVNVPRFIGYGHPEPLIDYTLMTRMLRRIHSIPLDSLRESGLFFGDQSPVDVRWRMRNLFDDFAEMIQQKDKDWNFHLTPEEVGRRLMRTLPDSKTIVALHSNPGPEHTFVDPASGKLTGVIDFGDAYFSHPVHDLRRYRSPADRQEAVEGYLESGPPDDDFMITWHVVYGIADMVAMVYSPEYQSAATEDLDHLLKYIS